MTMAGTIFDVYLNINILLIVAVLIWTATRMSMRLLGMSHAYALKLKLVKILVLAGFVAPAIVVLFDTYIRQTGTSAFSLSLSDLIVAQYLQGSLAVNAADLDAVLGLRNRMTEDFLGLQSNYAMIAFVCLVIGIAFSTIRLGISVYKLRQILNKCFTWRRFGTLHLHLSETVTTPFSTRSLFRRHVVLPTSMLVENQDLRIALGHELQHIRQRDTEWEVFLEFLRPFFFWNPAFMMLKREIEHLRELSCDQQVIVRRAIRVEDYCECLLRTCETGMRKRELFAGAIPGVAFVQLEKSPISSHSAQFLQHRLLSLIEGEKKQRHKFTMIAIMIPILGMMGLASVMMQKPNDWSHDRIMFSTVLNLDRLARLNTR